MDSTDKKPVSIVFCGMNDLGEKIYEWLSERDDCEVRCLITSSNQLDIISELQPDLAISSGFPEKVPEDIVTVPDRGFVNIHGSYLPHNRGANSNVWAILEDRPTGNTIHYMNDEIDAGPIIDRDEVPVYPEDTAKDVAERHTEYGIKQFKKVWPKIRDKTANTIEQDLSEGNYNKKSDFTDIWELDLERKESYSQMIDRLRALTHPPYKNAYFEKNGEKYFVEIKITPQSGVDDPTNVVEEEYRRIHKCRSDGENL